MFRPTCTLVALAAFVTAAPRALAGETDARSGTETFSPAQIEFFEKQVRPVLANNCHKCHGPETQKAGLRLDSRAGVLRGGETGPAIVPGKPEQSTLIEAINYDADSYQMPPPGKLSDEDIAALTKWVQMGAPWPPGNTPQPATTQDEAGIDLEKRAKHWSFQPVTRPQPPEVGQADWPRNPVDNFILARLEEKGLSPAPPASKRTLIRRVYYDLIGLPPTPEAIARFLEDDPPHAYRKLVDRLLASPRYGERWGRHWLDLVRFAETAGHEFDYEIPNAWPYRDYVIRAFNNDVPYDQFLTEHIAGDLLESPRRRTGTDTNESIIGTAFWWFGQGKHSPVDLRAEECDRIANQIDVFGKAFLGLTLACARCHDHKFDPVTQADYYALAAYLQSSRRQRAIIDPSERTQPHIDRLVELKSEYERLLREHLERAESIPAARSSRDAEAFLHEAVDVTARKELTHVLHPWAVLSAETDPQEFVRQRNELVEKLKQRWQAAANSGPQINVFDDFTGNVYDTWFVTGDAFTGGPTRPGDFVVGSSAKTEEGAFPRFLQPGLAHSGLVSGRLQGTLRSRTFEIEKPYIWYRLARVGGPKSPGRKLKNGQVHLIVDEFHFIKNPLYGGLTINVDRGGEFKWYRQDVREFVGKKVWIEIQNENDGWIVVDEIAFSDGGHPPEMPNQPVIEMFDDADVTSPDKLAAGYAELFAETLRLYTQDRLRSAAHPADRVEILNTFLRPEARLFQKAGLLEKYRQAESRIPPPRRALATADGSAENGRVLIRGNHTKPGEEVPRRFLEVLGGKEHAPPEQGSGRLQLAKQVVNPANPLTARVMVNRLWQHHFGRGIVATPDNVGVQGQPPTHPELLDWLAAEFLRRGWSIKAMHRLILLSNTYRMASRTSDSRAEKADPQNKLLHRMPVRRLEGEIVRDAVLATSGRLEQTMFGPGVMPHLTPFMEGRGRPGRSGPLDGHGRRSIYINVRRNFLTPLFLAFDYPLPKSTMGDRTVSNVPAQALTLMNNEFVIQQARVWAERLLREFPDSREKRLERLYETAYARPPSEKEKQAAQRFLERQGKTYTGPDDARTWADLCHVLMNVKEFIFVR